MTRPRLLMGGFIALIIEAGCPWAAATSGIFSWPPTSAPELKADNAAAGVVGRLRAR